MGKRAFVRACAWVGWEAPWHWCFRHRVMSFLVSRLHAMMNPSEVVCVVCLGCWSVDRCVCGSLPGSVCEASCVGLRRSVRVAAR